MNRRCVLELEKANVFVEQQVAGGSRAFVVPITYLQAGNRYKMQAFIEEAQQFLLNLGLNVTGMSKDDWAYTVFFEVQVPAPVEATKKCPMCAETIKAEALLCRFCGSNLN